MIKDVEVVLLESLEGTKERKFDTLRARFGRTFGLGTCGEFFPKSHEKVSVITKGMRLNVIGF